MTLVMWVAYLPGKMRPTDRQTVRPIRHFSLTLLCEIHLTTGKIIVLYILYISVAAGKTKDSELHGNKHSLNFSLLLFSS
jgi:hypothetical protein